MKYIAHILLGLLIVAPFFVLEWVTTAGFSQVGFPAVLFIFMWVNSSLFVGVLLSVFKDLRNVGGKFRGLWVLLKIIILIALASAFVTILADQMPCFLGARGC